MNKCSDMTESVKYEMNAWEKLERLLAQDQFELFDTGREDEVGLIYLMNDAVESWFVFRDAYMTGVYDKEAEGELEAELIEEAEQYVLIVSRNGAVTTLFFREMVLESHLYDYGKTGHFWMPGYEYLRQLEFRLAILHDKYTYLGPDYCTEQEKKLLSLRDFPPLNVMCYPAVPEKYRSAPPPDWRASGAALQVMERLSKQAGDGRLQRMLASYAARIRRGTGKMGDAEHISGTGKVSGALRDLSVRMTAKRIAAMLHENRHAAVVDLLTKELAGAAAIYPRRSFEPKRQAQHEKILQAALADLQVQQQAGKAAELLIQEPFVTEADDIDFEAYVMVYEEGLINRKVQVTCFTMTGVHPLKWG